MVQKSYKSRDRCKIQTLKSVLKSVAWLILIVVIFYFITNFLTEITGMVTGKSIVDVLTQPSG